LPGHTVKAGSPRVSFAAPADLLNLRTYCCAVFWILGTMKHSRHLSNAPGNRAAACVCLLAAVLLWSPLWAAAFHASDMACCDGVMCPLHGHSHWPAPAKESPATCEHHGKTAAMDCTLACCQPADSTLTQAILFVLPALPVISAAVPAGDSATNLFSSRASPVFDPASPPPRTSQANS